MLNLKYTNCIDKEKSQKKKRTSYSKRTHVLEQLRLSKLYICNRISNVYNNIFDNKKKDSHLSFNIT